MSRICIDITRDEHQKLKAMAALQGKSIKDYVIERTLGVNGDTEQKEALESLLDERIGGAKNGAVSRRTVGAIFKNAYSELKPK
ncbi:MAG TPA: antitoxin [Verrucomicrobiae bacterium]